MTETAKHLFEELDELRRENKALRKSTGFDRLSKALHRIADERDKLFEENKVLRKHSKTVSDHNIKLHNKNQALKVIQALREKNE